MENEYITVKEQLNRIIIPQIQFPNIEFLVRIERSMNRTLKVFKYEEDQKAYVTLVNGVFWLYNNWRAMPKAVRTAREKYPTAPILVHAFGTKLNFRLADRMSGYEVTPDQYTARTRF